MDTIETEQPNVRVGNAKIEELRHRTEDYVRGEPVKAVGIALIAGIFLTVFPIFRLLSGVTRLAFALLKPVLYVFGAMKLYEEYNKRSGTGS